MIVKDTKNEYLSLFDFVIDKRFAMYLPNYEIENVLSYGRFSEPKRTLNNFTKYYNIETYGKGQNLHIKVGDKKNNPFADGRSKSQTPKVIMKLLHNLEIANAKGQLNVNDMYTNKHWLRDLGNPLPYDYYNEMTSRVRAMYNETTPVDTPYYDLSIDIENYKTPLDDFEQVMLCELTTSTIDKLIDQHITRIGGQFRNKSKKLGYEWKQSYRGKTVTRRKQQINPITLEQETIKEPSYIIKLTDKQAKRYQDYINQNKPKGMTIQKFSKDEEYNFFIETEFGITELWQEQQLIKLPEPKHKLDNEQFVSVREEFVKYVYQSFITLTFGAKLQRTPYKYTWAIKLAEIAHKDDNAKQLLMDGNIEELKFQNFDNNLDPEQHVSVNFFYYKLIGDLALVPAYLQIIRASTINIELEPKQYTERAQQYIDNLLAQAEDDDLLQRALELCNPELFQEKESA